MNEEGICRRAETKDERGKTCVLSVTKFNARLAKARARAHLVELDLRCNSTPGRV